MRNHEREYEERLKEWMHLQKSLHKSCTSNVWTSKVYILGALFQAVASIPDIEIKSVKTTVS